MSEADRIGNPVSAIHNRFGRRAAISHHLDRAQVQTTVTFAGISSDALLARHLGELEQLVRAAGLLVVDATFGAGKEIMATAELPKISPRRPQGRMIDMW
jgi:hypothetical protein